MFAERFPLLVSPRLSRIFSKLFAVVSGQLAVMALLFIRNVALARILLLEDVAIATYFGIIAGTLEMIFEAGLSKYLVQAPDGDSPEAIGAVHKISSIRGCLLGGGIALAAWPVSWFLSCPQAAWGFCLLGLSPALKGFMHSHWIVEQRRLSFGPTNFLEISAQLAALAALLVGSIWIQDWRLGLVAILMQSVTGFAVSHWIATTPYRWDRSPKQWNAIRSFGMPLIANGALVVLTIYGDRFVLGSAPKMFPKSGITLEDIGAFNVVFGLAFTLSMGLFRIVNNLFLPILAKSRSNHDLLIQRIRMTGLAVALLATVIMVIALFVGPEGVRWIYGNQYDLGLLIIGLIACGQSLKLLRANANLISLSLGDSHNILWSNLVRALGIVFAIVGCVMGGGMIAIVVSGIVAETLSLIVALVLLRVQQKIPLRSLLEPIVYFVLVVAAAVIIRCALGNYY